MENHSEAVVKAKAEIINIKVKNANGENLGNIEEIILDKYTGQARYIVLSFGGLLGMGDKLFALPWQAISYSSEKGCFILDMPKEKLKNAPGFNKDHWPDMANPAWTNEIRNYYGLFEKLPDIKENFMKNFKEVIPDAKEKFLQGAKIGKKGIKKFANDGCQYIEAHPLKSMLWGAGIYFAIKSLFKK